MEVKVFDHPGQVLLDPASPVLVVPELRVGHFCFQRCPVLLLLSDPEIGGRLIQPTPEREQLGGEVLHVSPRGTA